MQKIGWFPFGFMALLIGGAVVTIVWMCLDDKRKNRLRREGALARGREYLEQFRRLEMDAETLFHRLRNEGLRCWDIDISDLEIWTVEIQYQKGRLLKLESEINHLGPTIEALRGNQLIPMEDWLDFLGPLVAGRRELRLLCDQISQRIKEVEKWKADEEARLKRRQISKALETTVIT
ncbi:MAG: hypothetical protein V4467_04600 [Patescibacteria group bacterium]